MSFFGTRTAFAMNRSERQLGRDVILREDGVAPYEKANENASCLSTRMYRYAMTLTFTQEVAGEVVTETDHGAHRRCAI